MKLKLKTEAVVDGWFLCAFLGNIADWWKEEPFEFDGKEYISIDEFEKDYPCLVGFQPPYYSVDPKEGTKTLKLCIELGTGKVLNWPDEINFDFNDYKLVDTGRYEIRRQDGELQAEYAGYVPSCLSIDDAGYGDYLQFHIEDGHVVSWKFTQADYDSFVSESEED